MAPTRLMIVDSDQRFWDTAQFELAIDPRIDRVTRVDSPQSAIAGLGSVKPGVVIINMSVPGPATADLIRVLGSGPEATPVIGLFDSLDDGSVGYAIGAGARACISRTSPAKQIRGTVIEVLAGDLPIHRDVAERPHLLTGLIVEFQRQSRGGAKTDTSACPLTVGTSRSMNSGCR